jgi:hypothetical protein
VDWAAASRPAAVGTARHGHFATFPVRWLGGLIAFAALLITLLNLRRLINGLRDRKLRAHPERAPRESAALWYDRMVGRMARLGWRKRRHKHRWISSRPFRKMLCNRRWRILRALTSPRASASRWTTPKAYPAFQ